MTCILLRGGEESLDDTQKGRGRGDSDPKALALTVRATQPPAEDCQLPPEAGGGKEQILLQSLQGAHTAQAIESRPLEL